MRRAPGPALVALATLGALASRAPAAPAFVPPAPGRHEARLPIQPPQTVYLLGQGFVLAGSDTATVRGRLLVRGRDYFLDPIAGEFRLNTVLSAGDTVRVVYRALLAPPPATYFARGAQPPVGRPPAPAGAPADTAGAPFAPRPRPGTIAETGVASAGGPMLELAGNKSVALDFGNTRDVALRQSLDLHVNGRLSPGVDLLAVLSDRNTPLSAEGGTRELAELDRILLEVKGPRAGGTLGDWTLRQERGEFARVTRELTGVEARGGSEDVSGRAALAGVKGQFVSRQFAGVEGLQGPYLLPDEGGATGVAVVVGSEEVWLDGEKLARGESADYAMDYERGTITFTARRLISAASRIAVDYQVALTAYHRSLSSLGGQAQKGGLTAYGQYLREADAADRPLTFSLDASDRYALQTAPDTATFAVGSGVSPGPGDYDAFADSAGITRFVFAGFDQGGFKVSFASVGAAQGDYAESTRVLGRAIFRYVGAGRGTHVVGRRLALPTSLAVVDGGLSFTPFGGARVEGELARSSNRANTLSLAGSPLEGTAGAARAEAGGAVRLFGRGLGRLAGAVSLRRFDEDFRAPGRLDPAFAEEDWGVGAERPLAAQDRRSAALTWTPRPGFELGGEWARLDADSDFSAERRRGTLRTTGRLGLIGRLEHVDNRRDAAPPETREGFRDKATLAATWGGWTWLRPQATLDFEDRVPPGSSDSAAVRYRAWTAGAAAPEIGPVALTASLGVRTDAARDAGAWTPWTRATNARGAATARLGAGVTAALGAERRVRSPEGDGAPARQATDLGYTRLRQDLGGGHGEHEASFEWTGEAVERRAREVRFVGTDAGAYDSLGNFTGRGDYDVVLVATGTYDRVVRTTGSYRLDLRPGAGLGDSSSTGALFGDARLSFLAQANAAWRGPFTLDDVLYGPKRLLSNEDAVFGTYVLRPEAQFGGRTRYAQFLFRLERRSAVDRQFEGSSTVRDEWTEEARWRTRPDPRWLSEVTMKFGQGDATQVGGAFNTQRRLVSQGLTGELTWLPSVRWRVGALGSYDRADVADDGVEPSRVTRLGPRVVWTKGGTLRAEFLARRALVSGGAVPALVPSGFPLFPDTWDYTFETSARVRERANLVLSAQGRKPSVGKVVHTGRAELRAYF